MPETTDSLNADQPDITEQLRSLENGWDEPRDVIQLANRAAIVITQLRAELANAKRK